MSTPIAAPTAFSFHAQRLAVAAAPKPLRPRHVEAVARTACRLFVGDDAIDIHLDDGADGRWPSVLASLREEYGRRRADALTKGRDAAEWLANLDYEMGLRAVEKLAGSLCALFGFHENDVTRRALAFECVGAMADHALTCRDEAWYRAHQPGSAAPLPDGRTLILTRQGDGRLQLRKETRWGPAAAGVPNADSGGPHSSSASAAMSSPTSPPTSSSFEATMNLAVLPPRPRGDGGSPRLRGRLHCTIDPVRVDTGGAGHRSSAARRGIARCLAWLRNVVSRLFRRLSPSARSNRHELRLVVDPAPRDYGEPSVTRVGKDWRVCESSRPLWRGVQLGTDDVRRHSGWLRRRQFGLDLVADDAPTLDEDDDGVRLY